MHRVTDNSSRSTHVDQAILETQFVPGRTLRATGSEKATFEIIAAAAVGAGLLRWRQGIKVLDEAADAPAGNRTRRWRSQSPAHRIHFIGYENAVARCGARRPLPQRFFWRSDGRLDPG